MLNDDSIVIKEADKGGAVVVMDAEYYKHKILEMLDNNEFYCEIAENNDKKTIQKVKRLLKDHQTSSDITTKEADFLTDFDFRESVFYGLPKIHKSKTITNAIKMQNNAYITCIKPDDLKFRPIVGGPNAPTQRLSHLMDILLKPLCSEVKSYVRDDLDFLRYLPDKVNQDAKLVTMDVTNLYTNITTDLGINALKYWINKYPQNINSRFSREFILEASSLVLKNNTFSFNGKHYLQLKRTAMGTKMAPTYATLTLGYLEEKMYEKARRQFNHQTAQNIKNGWKRYLDDCFIIWDESDANLTVFLDIVNNLDPNINFTLDESAICIPFLDVLISKCGENITTDMYYKPTDTHQYLHFSSCHPGHTKRAIPYNLARRVCTIVSDNEKRNERLHELKASLIKQCYPVGIIDDGIKKALALNRENLINPPENNTSDLKILPLVTTHNPNDINIIPVVRQLNNILQTDEKMSEVLKKYNFINSKRQPRNLRRILCKSSFQRQSYSVSKCNDPRCGTCQYIKVGKSFKFGDKVFIVNANMSCASKHVIYNITCSGCNEFYIGETGTTLRTRIRIHKQHVNQPEYRKIKLSEHLDICGHGQFSVFPFYKLYTDNAIERREKEKHFIKSLKPSLNSLI